MPNSLTPSIVTPGIDQGSLPIPMPARLSGLESPNPGINRLRGLPTVMASPPALSVASTPQIAGGTLVGPFSPTPLRYACGLAQIAGAGYPDNNFVLPFNCSEGSVSTPARTAGTGMLAVDFETDADQFEVFLKGTGSPVRGMADAFDGNGFQYFTSQAPAWAASTAYTAGAYPNKISQVSPVAANGYIYGCITAGTSGSSEPAWPVRPGYRVTDGTAVWANSGKSPAYQVTPSDGNFYYLRVNFGARAFRRIRLEGSLHFGGIFVDPKNTVWPSTLPFGPKVIVIGDSFTEGTGAGQTNWFGDTLGKQLGWYNVQPSGLGGTGYLQTTGTPFFRPTFRSRASLDITSQNPDIVIIAGGINDQSGSSAAAIQAEAALLFAQIKAGLPNCKLIVLGPFWTGGSPIPAVVQTRDALKAASAGYADLFIDNIGGTYPYDGNATHYVDTGWITGTYNTTTPASATKNTFYYQGGGDSTDSTHPSPLGHDYYGHRIAAAIAAAMPL